MPVEVVDWDKTKLRECEAHTPMIQLWFVWSARGAEAFALKITAPKSAPMDNISRIEEGEEEVTGQRGPPMQRNAGPKIVA